MRLVENNASQGEMLFDINELSKYLSLSTKWIYTRTCRHEIPHYKIGGALRFKKSEIDKWVESEMKIPVEK